MTAVLGTLAAIAAPVIVTMITTILSATHWMMTMTTKMITVLMTVLLTAVFSGCLNDTQYGLVASMYDHPDGLVIDFVFLEDGEGVKIDQDIRFTLKTSKYGFTDKYSQTVNPSEQPSKWTQGPDGWLWRSVVTADMPTGYTVDLYVFTEFEGIEYRAHDTYTT